MVQGLGDPLEVVVASGNGAVGQMLATNLPDHTDAALLAYAAMTVYEARLYGMSVVLAFEDRYLQEDGCEPYGF